MTDSIDAWIISHRYNWQYQWQIWSRFKITNEFSFLFIIIISFIIFFAFFLSFLFLSCFLFAKGSPRTSHRSRRPLNYFMHNGTKATLRSKSNKEKRLHRSNSSHVITENLNSCLSSLCVRKSMYLIKVIVNCQMTVDGSGCWSEKHVLFFKITLRLLPHEWFRVCKKKLQILWEVREQCAMETLL